MSGFLDDWTSDEETSKEQGERIVSEREEQQAAVASLPSPPPPRLGLESNERPSSGAVAAVRRKVKVPPRAVRQRIVTDRVEAEEQRGRAQGSSSTAAVQQTERGTVTVRCSAADAQTAETALRSELHHRAQRRHEAVARAAAEEKAKRQYVEDERAKAVAEEAVVRAEAARATELRVAAKQVAVTAVAAILSETTQVQVEEEQRVNDIDQCVETAEADMEAVQKAVEAEEAAMCAVETAAADGAISLRVKETPRVAAEETERAAEKQRATDNEREAKKAAIRVEEAARTTAMEAADQQRVENERRDAWSEPLESTSRWIPLSGPAALHLPVSVGQHLPLYTRKGNDEDNMGGTAVSGKEHASPTSLKNRHVRSPVGGNNANARGVAALRASLTASTDGVKEDQEDQEVLDLLAKAGAELGSSRTWRTSMSPPPTTPPSDCRPVYGNANDDGGETKGREGGERTSVVVQEHQLAVPYHVTTSPVTNRAIDCILANVTPRDLIRSVSTVCKQWRACMNTALRESTFEIRIAAILRREPDCARPATTVTDRILLTSLTRRPCSLRLLDLSWCSTITDRGLEGVAMNCPSLVHVDLRGCKGVTLAGAEWMMRCPALVFLNLTGCPSCVDLEALEKAASNVAAASTGRRLTVLRPGGGGCRLRILFFAGQSMRGGKRRRPIDAVMKCVQQVCGCHRISR